MAGATSGWSLKKLGRLTALASVIAVSLLAAWLGLQQVSVRITEADCWRAALWFLIALEGSYFVTAVLCIVGIPWLIVRLLNARKYRIRRPLTARVLLLCFSILFGLLVSEITAATLRAKFRSSSVVPAGALKQDRSADQNPKLPVPTEEIALPETFPAPADNNAVNITILGESSAAGVPYNFWFSMGDILAWKLGEAIPDKKFQLQLVALSGDTLEGQHRKLADISRRPDILIIYCGHNEFSARFPWSRDLEYYVDAGSPTPWDRFVDQVERLSPLCSLMRLSADKCRVAIPPPPDGYRALVDSPAYTAQEYAALLADFERRLEAIVAYGNRLGTMTVLVIPPANDAGFEPNRSYLPAEVRRAERKAFAAEFSAARARESTDPKESIQAYRSLLSRQPGFAEVHYRLGQLLEQSGSWEEAHQHYVAARDCDGLPMRCPTAFQDVYRKVARRHDCALIDAPALFHQIGPHGLLNDNLFHDGMHPSLRGIITLSQSILSVLHERRAFGWPQDSIAPTVVDPVHCVEKYHLGPREWTKLCHWGIMFYMMTAPARYDPSFRRAKEKAFGKAADEITGGASPESVGLPNIGVPEAVPRLPLIDPARLSSQTRG